LRLMLLFEELNRLGTTIVIATHNMSLVDGLGYPIMRLDDGHFSLIEGSGNRSPTRERRELRESAKAAASARRRRPIFDADDNDTEPPGIENFL